MRSLLLLLSVILILGRVADATPSTFMAPVPISPQAIAADPVLASFQTWDLRVDVPPGENWGYSGFLATLSQGQFYNSPLGANWPLPQTWQVFPQLRFDTFVTQAADPDDDSTFRAPQWNSGYPDYPAPIEFTDTRTSVVFLSLYGTFTGPGTFTIGRLTFSNDAVGSIIGFTAGRAPSTGPDEWSFPLPVPEPGAGLLMCLQTMLLKRQARRPANSEREQA